ncbi:hypothetical protein [Chitinophaga sp. YR573]|uniref:hypothetical protein n=1 Tax=Chitinophaga sp. YR573 TaxID=1881040 RepID=UPI0015A5031A|nr:hypothetical protein [Chitinophaga sp. YR573]
MEQNYRELIELLLPAGILEYFELTNTTKDSKRISIFLEEKKKRLALWYNDVDATGIQSFKTLSRTVQNHYQGYPELLYEM